MTPTLAPERTMNQAEAQQLYDECGSCEKVGKHLGMNRQNAWYWLRELKVKLKTRGGVHHGKMRDAVQIQCEIMDRPCTVYDIEDSCTACILRMDVRSCCNGASSSWLSEAMAVGSHKRGKVRQSVGRVR